MHSSTAIRLAHGDLHPVLIAPTGDPIRYPPDTRVESILCLLHPPPGSRGLKQTLQANLANLNGTKTMSPIVQQWVLGKAPEHWPFAIGRNLVPVGLTHAVSPGDVHVGTYAQPQISMRRFGTIFFSPDPMFDGCVLGAGKKRSDQFVNTPLFLLGPTKKSADDILSGVLLSRDTGHLPTARPVPLLLPAYADSVTTAAELFLHEMKHDSDGKFQHDKLDFMRTKDGAKWTSEMWRVFEEHSLFFKWRTDNTKLQDTWFTFDTAGTNREKATMNVRNFAIQLAAFSVAQSSPISRVGYMHGYIHSGSLNAEIQASGFLSGDRARPALVVKGLPNVNVDVLYDPGDVKFDTYYSDSASRVRRGTLLVFTFNVNGDYVRFFQHGLINVQDVMRNPAFNPLFDLVEKRLCSILTQAEFNALKQFERGQKFEYSQYSPIQQYMLKLAVFESAQCVGAVSQATLNTSGHSALVCSGFTGVSVASVFELTAAPVNTSLVLRQAVTKKEEMRCLKWANKILTFLKDPRATAIQDEALRQQFIIPLLTSEIEPFACIEDMQKGELSSDLESLVRNYTPNTVADVFLISYGSYFAACGSLAAAGNNRLINIRTVYTIETMPALTDNYPSPKETREVLEEVMYSQHLSPHRPVNFQIVYVCDPKTTIDGISLFAVNFS